MNTTTVIGDMTIHRVVEMQAPFMDALEFLPTLTPELLAENRSWLEPDALDAQGRLIFCFQSYIVRTPHHTVLIDTCIGNDKNHPMRPTWHMRSDDTYMRGLAASGLSVDDVDYVMCTHLHPDHVGWNTRRANGRWVPTFPKARYLFSGKEYAYWTDRHAREPIPYMADSVLPIVEAKRAELVTSDHALDDHITLMPTPGHTPDHFAVCLGRGGRDAVVAGDLIHSPLQARYPEISMRADFDAQQAARTRRSFLDRYCDSTTICCTAHFPSPSMGRIARWGDGFRCTPVTM
jgi:glyoxylase-like metal-dependent hydrolase (beta-lactamase superfamily II)